jgi:flagellar basal-body rod protein FlgC
MALGYPKYSIENTLEISISGLAIQREKLEIIASNLANINTTRSLDGGPYRRKVAVIGEQPLDFAHELARAEQKLVPGGVKLIDIDEDRTPFQRVYDPGHPDADSSGYVLLPNVSLSKEMVDMVYTSRLYDANITAFNVAKKMAQDTLQLP